MVSPLKTWQHDEPKRLWLALGGLSVLAHIGVLGLSLPYILTIMQPSGEPTPSSVVPVELVADPVDQSAAERAAELAENQAAEDRAAKAASEAEANARAAASAASPLPSPEPDLPEPPKRPPTMSTYTQSQTQRQAIANHSPSPTPSASSSTSQNSSTGASSSTSKNDPASDPSGSTNENSSTSDPSGSTTENSAASGSTGENNSATTSPNLEASADDNSAGSADSGSDETSVINGTGPLPAPGTASNGTSSEQVAYLSILGSLEVPKDLQRDVVTSPPKLISNTADVATIEWRPHDLDCGRVDFSQPTGTYKIAVNADGTMDKATLWTNGITPQATSESEGAIACLLKSADLAFEPARLDGEAVFNDNLLLTVKIIEAQPK